MQIILNEPNFNLPHIFYDTIENTINLKGKSMPANAPDSCLNVFSCIEKSSEISKIDNITFHFYFEISSSSSLQPIYRIIPAANDFAKLKIIEIIWKSELEYEDMFYTGLFLEKQSQKKIIFTHS
jgi:hypothetical protein